MNTNDEMELEKNLKEINEKLKLETKLFINEQLFKKGIIPEYLYIKAKGAFVKG